MLTETIKTLGQVDLAATTLTDVYTVPGSTTAVISSVVFCNRTAAAITIRLSIAVAGLADTNKQYLLYDKACPANEAVVIQIGVTLGAADVVRAYAAATGISVNVFGTEQS
jgi:hypothetical protein